MVLAICVAPAFLISDESVRHVAYLDGSHSLPGKLPDCKHCADYFRTASTLKSPWLRGERYIGHLCDGYHSNLTVVMAACPRMSRSVRSRSRVSATVARSLVEKYQSIV